MCPACYSNALVATIQAIRWENGALSLLDQRKLPREESWVRCTRADEVASAIREMVVRGAPAIGVTAAFGIVIGLANREGTLEELCAKFAATRPTAVNLFWAIERMKEAARAGRSMEETARAIFDDDVAVCRAIGKHGAEAVPAQAGILTHCNTGSLATAGFGTALGVVRAAREAGKSVHVFADETRPFLQGARLTAWECVQEGIPVTLLCDGAAASLMKRGKINFAIVGADRVAANGDVANKIGTYSVALAAKHHGIPFYVAAPLSTVDLETQHGDAIPIEQRDPKEVTHVAGTQIAPDGVAVENPSFDVTPAELIAGIVTERGICRPPYRESLEKILDGEKVRRFAK